MFTSAEGGRLPELPLVLPQVQHVEGLAALDFHEALPSGVDGKPSNVGSDPSTAEFLSNCRRRTRANEEVGHEVLRVARGLQDAFEQGLRLLSGIVQPLG